MLLAGADHGAYPEYRGTGHLIWPMGTPFSAHYSLLGKATWSPSHKRDIETDAFGTQRYSDLIMEIIKVIDGRDPTLDRTVLVFEIKNSCHWERGKEALLQDIGE
jgi:hypothetical protein